MFKVYYKYGVMNSSKTASLLMVAHNYHMKGVKTYFIAPEQDTRTKDHYIKARIGLKQKADIVVRDFDSKLASFLMNAYVNDGTVFIDECQFISYDTVLKMINFCHQLEEHAIKKGLIMPHNFCIITYGLLKDFNNQLFDGSRAWLEQSDSIHEIKTLCKYCPRKATCNLLRKDLAAKQKGNLLIGDSIYESVCPYHYYKNRND